MLHRPSTVVLDACVLANHTVADVLLRLAEDPRLILPRWSEEILTEVRRTHLKLGWPDTVAESWQTCLRECFPEAMVPPQPALAETLGNDPKDRHVLASAIHCQAVAVLTFNLRDFPADDLAPWGIDAIHPDDFLLEWRDAAPEVFDPKIAELAARHTHEGMLQRLRRHLPELAAAIARDAGAGEPHN